MNAVLSTVISFFANRFAGQKERGATAVEYGLLVALIAVVIIAGVTLLGDNLLAMFNDIAGKVGGGTTTS